MLENLISARELEFVIKIGFALVCGVMIGLERELVQKPAGISTQSLVIIGAAMFAFMSQQVGEGDPGRIAAQIVSGVGFLGAGIILKSEKKGKVSNLTTAASIWYAAAVGMAIGFDFYVIALVATVVAVVINRIPHVRKYIDD
jgi:putative Mg2+ transporter-C (MgtC) family protein